MKVRRTLALILIPAILFSSGGAGLFHHHHYKERAVSTGYSPQDEEDGECPVCDFLSHIYHEFKAPPQVFRSHPVMHSISFVVLPEKPRLAYIALNDSRAPPEIPVE